MLRILVALVLALATLGCAGMPGIQISTGPVIAEGTFTDPTGAAIAGAEVTLEVVDWEGAMNDVAISTIWSTTTRTDAVGRFVFRGVPPPAILAFAGAEGSVNFALTGMVPRTMSIAAWSFSRALVGTAWGDEAPAIDLRADGAG